MSDRVFVRVCPAPSCKGASPFQRHARYCGLCGRRRAEACATVLVRRSSSEELLWITDLLDREFNSHNFVGSIHGQITRVDRNLWAIDYLELSMPLGSTSRISSGHMLVRSTFLRAGLRVLEPIELPARLPRLELPVAAAQWLAAV